MIHAEKKKNGLAIRASGNPEEIIRELGEITASIFAEILIDDMTEALRQHHVDRLKQHKCSAKNGMIYLDILTNLERIGDHAENIASSVDKPFHHLQA